MPVDNDRTLSVNAERAFAACYSAAMRPGHDSTGQSRASFLVRHHSGSHLKANSHHSVPGGGCGKHPPERATVLRQGPHRKLALHAQAWQLLKLLCPLLYQFQTKFYIQSWHLHLELH